VSSGILLAGLGMHVTSICSTQWVNDRKRWVYVKHCCRRGKGVMLELA